MRPFPAAVLSEPRQGGMHAAETICPFVNQPPHFLSVERVGGRAEIFRKTVTNFSCRVRAKTLHFSLNSPCHRVFGWLRVRNIKADLLRDWKWENVFMNLSTILLIVQDIGVTSVIKLGWMLMTTLGAPQRCYSCDWNGLGGCKKSDLMVLIVVLLFWRALSLFQK